jgi:hypothetical protein
MVWEAVGEMAGAIVLTSTNTMPGRDIPGTAGIIRSSIIVVAAVAASTPVEVFTVVVAEATAVVVAIAEPLP